MGILERASRSFFWRVVHPLSPVYRYCEYNGVVVDRAVRYCHLPFEPGSAYRPPMIRDVPDYEAALCQGLQQNVQEGDHVVVVGGGFGVTAVHAARHTGQRGRVTAFEAAQQQFASLKWGIGSNDQDDIVTPIHALVGEEVVVYGETNSAERYSPKDLPECNVLELDCEGTETEILRSMDIRPRILLVETHGFRGAPTREVDEILCDMGYTTTNLGVAEPRIRQECTENDIYVLLARR